MIVIERNGKTVVLTGWRAWLAGAATLIVTWLVLGVVAFLFVGIGLTVGAILLLAIPAVIGVSLLASVFRRRG